MENWILPFSITISYTVITVIIGVKAKGKMDMKKMENWSVSGSTLGTVISFFLLGAANISCYTFMGAPGWGCAKGVAACYVVVGLSFATFFAYLVNPRVNRLAQKAHILTLAESYGRRYESKGIRAITSLVASLATIGMACIQVMGIGYILMVMSNGHIPFWLGQLIVLIAMFTYLFKSGVKAIGWTNVFQGVLMFILSLTTCMFIMFKVNNSLDLSNVFNTVASVSPAHLTLPGKLGDMPPIYWTTSILITMFAFWPGAWTGAASAKSPKIIRKSTLLLPFYYLMMIPMIIVGFICIYSLTGFSGTIDQAALTLVSQKLPIWFVGIFGAGVLASAQSTCEPQFHTTALTLTRDLIMPFSKNQSPERAGKIQRWMLVPVMFGLTFPLAVFNPASMVYINLICAGFVVQLTPLLLGLLIWPRCTKTGAIAGLVSGLIIVVLFNIVWPTPLGINPGVWGWIVNIPVNIVVSLCTKPAKRETLEIFFPGKLLDEFYNAKQ